MPTHIRRFCLTRLPAAIRITPFTVPLHLVALHVGSHEDGNTFGHWTPRDRHIRTRAFYTLPKLFVVPLRRIAPHFIFIPQRQSSRTLSPMYSRHSLPCPSLLCHVSRFSCTQALAWGIRKRKARCLDHVLLHHGLTSLCMYIAWLQHRNILR